MTPTAVSAAEKREALNRALHSRTLARSEQLRAFLRYVCMAEADGRTDQLSEHLIGTEVLGRPADYLPSEDSSVRTRAWELRHKLEKLYAVEAPDATVRIVLPKGSYTPEFVRAAGFRPDSESTAAEDIPVRVTQPSRRKSLAVVAALVAVAVLVSSGATVLIMKHAAGGENALLREAWGPLANSAANVLLCVATPLHLVVTPEGHQTYGSPIYPAPPEAYNLFRQHRPLEPEERLSLVFTDNVVGLGILNAVVTVTNRLRSLGVAHQVLPERVAPISAFRQRNVMMFGAPVDSEALSRTHASLPLTVDYEPAIQEFAIRDRQTSTYLAPRKNARGEFLEVYGLLTVLRASEPAEGAPANVAFSGITSTGAQGAAEFFASASAMSALRKRFEREGVRGYPAAYQVVVKCTYSNLLLLSWEYHSHRIIRKD